MAFVFRRDILIISGAEEAVLAAALPYYLLVAVPSVFVCLTLVLSACLRATQDTVTPMLVSGGANLLNIGLDWLFLRLGLGLAGLALATTLSRVVSSVILLVRLLRGNGTLYLKGADFRPDGEILRSIGKTALPAGVERLLMRAGQLVYNGFIFSIGTNAYVAHSVAGTIEYYSYIPAFGFSAAAATLVGISLGEQDPGKARDITWKTWLSANAIMIPMGIVFFAASPGLTAQFSDTLAVQNQAVQVLRLIAFFQPALAFSNVFAGPCRERETQNFPCMPLFSALGWCTSVWAGCWVSGWAWVCRGSGSVMA